MYTYIYIYTYSICHIYIYIYIYIMLCYYLLPYIYIYIYMYLCLFLHICTYIYIYICIYLSLALSLSIYIYILYSSENLPGQFVPVCSHLCFGSKLIQFFIFLQILQNYRKSETTVTYYKFVTGFLKTAAGRFSVFF